MQDKHKIISFQYYSAWNDNNLLTKYYSNEKTAVWHACGFLVREDDNFLTIAQRESIDYVSGQLEVPKQCIIKDTYKEHFVIPKISDDFLNKKDGE